MSRLLLIMLDGVSAAYFRSRRANLPNLDALARRGLTVGRVAAEVPGTSLPGRTSIATGVPASEHGIFGNLIWDGDRFRYANPDDVRVTTLTRAAEDAGLRSGVVGFGMIRPEDASVFKGPWWANEMLQRARDEEPIPADESWLRTSRFDDRSGIWERSAATGPPLDLPDAYAGDITHYLLAGAAGDRIMMQWSASLMAAEEGRLDLLLTEILIPDSVQHLAGREHHFSDWAIGYADDLVGTLLATLERNGRLEETTVMVTSDHGHGKVERALYTDRLLPGRPVGCEGALLLAQVDGERDAQRLARELAGHAIERLPSGYLPADRRGEVAIYCAPEGHAFQPRPTGHDDGRSLGGPPKYSSTHGFRPGHPDDERFLVVAGPGIEPLEVEWAAAEDVAATAAAILGLYPFGNGISLL